MKHLIYLLICMVSSIGLISCSNEDDLMFSCDKTTDAWAKENLASIRSMDRSEWKKLSPEKKRAAYVAFTKEQRIAFWKDKLTEVMTLDWSEAERNHIKLAYDFVVEHPDLFGDESLTDEQANILDLFSYRWIEEAQTKFGWDKGTIGSIIASGEEVVKTKNKTRFAGELHNDVTYGSKSCNCSLQSDWCDIPLQNGSECEDVNCEQSFKGCGTFLQYDCTGKCSLLF